MFSNLVVHLLLACFIVGGVIILFFLWLNSKDSKVDDSIYKKDFNPEDAVSHYMHRGAVKEDEYNHLKALSRYAQSNPEKPKDTDKK